ncbi:MAG: DNA recombination/repair protein RecA, partial [Acidobacteriota bacterium]|nr:DNA recombination/repair protein RecA [Acidobacteriota bacterium]
VKEGIVEKSGAWFSYGGERLGQGRENSKNALRENPELLQRVQTDVRKKLGLHVPGDSEEEAAAAKADGKK